MRPTHLLALTGILLLAAITRIYHIDLQSLWIDEGFTWHLTQYPDPLWILRNDVHPPLYFMAMDGWVEFAGVSVVALRYFSVLPSLLSIAVVYQLGREIVRGWGWHGGDGRWIPVLAALLMALADSENYLAQEARSYTWHVLFASLSMWGFLRWLRVGTRRWLGLWLGSTIALVYTFYLGAFVGVAQGVVALGLLLDGKQRRKGVTALLVLGVAAASLLPWLLLTGGEQASNASRAEVIRPEAYGFWLGEFRVRYFTGQWALMLALCVLGAFGFGKFGLMDKTDAIPTGTKRPTPTLPAFTLLLWVCLPLLLTLVINQFAPVYQPRRVSQIVPAIALLGALGLGHLRGRERALLLIVIVVYGMSSTDVWRYKQPWRDFAEATVDLIAPQTPIFFEVGGDEYAPRYHYDQLLPDSTPTIGLTTWRNLEPDNYQAGMPALIRDAGHLWLFYWSSDMGALTWLDTWQYQRSATIQAEFNPDVFLYRYDQRPDAPRARYANGLVLQAVLLHDAPLVELLWSTDALLAHAYTTSVVLLDADGQIVAQHDSPPFFNQRPTTGWTTDALIYDPKPVTTPDGSPIPAGEYAVQVVVYHTTGQGIERARLVSGADHVAAGHIRLR